MKEEMKISPQLIADIKKAARSFARRQLKVKKKETESVKTP
jgi:hypothetical protein